MGTTRWSLLQEPTQRTTLHNAQQHEEAGLARKLANAEERFVVLLQHAANMAFEKLFLML